MSIRANLNTASTNLHASEESYLSIHNQDSQIIGIITPHTLFTSYHDCNIVAYLLVFAGTGLAISCTSHINRRLMIKGLMNHR